MSVVHLAPTHPLNSDTQDSWLVTAYRGGRPAVTPVWFMRQAGRSLPEYRALRVGTRMLDACLDPELASEITLQPVRRHGVDAAIFFSDIVVPLKLAGVPVDIEPGVGPVFATPVDSPGAVEALVAQHPAEALGEALAPITEAVARTVAGLRLLHGGRDPLIGFAGAPFTLAAYLVAGRPSKDQLAARAMMHRHPAAWAALLGWCAELSGRFLRAQVLAGASAVQLFDSWAGSLPAATYAAQVAPTSRATFDAVRDLVDEQGRRVPLVHFAVGAGELYGELNLDVDCVGVDWRTPLDEAARRIGGPAVQGNLDPALLGAPWPVLRDAIDEVLRRGQSAPGHVFNLGHGVPPDTDPEVLTRIVDHVHSR
ncbi:MAG: uroporphyrinogen decarboxylase [Micropruina sp.]